MKIEDRPVAERPRERLRLAGPSGLSLRELLAILLGSGPRGVGCLGLAAMLLERYGRATNQQDEEHGFFDAMAAGGLMRFEGLRGLGVAGAARLNAALEIGRRYAIRLNGDVQRSESVGAFNQSLASTGLPASRQRWQDQALRRVTGELRADSREWLGFVPISAQGRVGGLCVVERGVRTHVNVDPQELFAAILGMRPRAVCLFHNHPSGRLSPSAEDVELTRWVSSLASVFGIELLGHWIVTPSGERHICCD